VTGALLLAVLASATLTIGLYLLKRATVRLPSLDGGARAWLAMVSDPMWLCGLGLQIAGYALYLTALREAPLSLVHTVLNGGVALFVALSVYGLGERARPSEWLGVAVTLVALLLLGSSLSEEDAAVIVPHGELPFSLVATALSALAIAADRSPRRPIGCAIAAGLLLGLGSVYAKDLATAPSFAAAFGSVHFPLALVANTVGFALMQWAFQAGRGLVVMPLFSCLSNLVPVVAGVVVFGEALPDHGMAAVLRPLTFALALAGTALLAGVGERSGALEGEAPTG
jgi:uncharacterized membrane protein